MAQVAPLTVRARRAATAAHYENRDGTGVIAVPDLDTADWAMRELVVLHEIAHHLCDASPPHGSEYVATLCTLAELVMGPEARPRAAGGVRQRGRAVAATS